jgi:hypothetical protein
MQIVAQRLGKPVGGLLFGRSDGWLWGHMAILWRRGPFVAVFTAAIAKLLVPIYRPLLC